MIGADWHWTILSFAASFFSSWLLFAIIWYLVAYSHGKTLVRQKVFWKFLTSHTIPSGNKEKESRRAQSGDKSNYFHLWSIVQYTFKQYYILSILRSLPNTLKWTPPRYVSSLCIDLDQKLLQLYPSGNLFNCNCTSTFRRSGGEH